MIKKSIIAIVVIVAAAALVFGASNHINSTSNTDQEKQQTASTDSGSTSNNNSSQTKKISAEEAKEIAKNYIEEPGATAGTPTLNGEDGNYVYTVPVILNGTNVGEISIDAQTGKNVGGAGGAP